MLSSRWLLGAVVFTQSIVAQTTQNTTASIAQSAASSTTMGSISTSMNATKAAAPKSSIGSKPDPPDTIMNWKHAQGLAWAWIALIVLLTVYNLSIRHMRYLRKLACLDNNSQQNYFKRRPWLFNSFKKHISDAPLFQKRHHREIMVTPKINMGAIPNRPQAIFVVLYVATMLLLTFIHIDYSKPERYWHPYLMKRTGTLAIFNLLPLFILAGRNNPLITVTGVTFDTYNLIHRWIGRVVIFEALAHSIAYLTKKAHGKGGIGSVKIALRSAFVQQGMTAAVAVTLILLTTPVFFRRAFYETFLHIHQALVIALLAAIWFHTEEYSRHRGTLKGVIAIWTIERGIRLIRIIYYSVGKRSATAEVSSLPGGAVQVKVTLARPWRFTPGQHAYIYIPKIGWWTSHPFSVVWCDEDEQSTKGIASSSGSGHTEAHSNSNGSSEGKNPSDIEKEAMSVVRRTESNSWERPQSIIYFIVRPKAGFTGKLGQKAKEASFTTRAFVEGPYNEQKLHSYGTVILFAAGVGITHALPHVKDLVQGYSDRTVAARKVVLFWALMNPDCLEWIREWMDIITSIPRCSEVLKVVLYIFSGMDDREAFGPSPLIQTFSGIPNSETLLDGEIETAVGAIGVSVCGIGAMADDVRFACRKWMDRVNIDLEEESFSW